MSLKAGSYSLKSGSGKLSVLTFKEGMLSVIAHDLQLDVTDYKVDVNVPEEGFGSGSLNVELQANSLKVDFAMKDGQPNPGCLKEKDIADIEKDMFKKVLHPDKYPTVSFCSKEIQVKDGGYHVSGELDLHGAKKPVAFDVDTSNDNNLKGTFVIKQTDYGVKPFKAMMGTLKVKDELKFAFDLPLS